MDARRTTVRDMRRSNRSVILTSIYRDGPLSRYELGRQTSLSAAGVSNLVAELLDEGIVEEAGSVESDGGRPRVLLRVAPTFGYVVGAEVGETRVRVELFDLAMALVRRVEYSLGAQTRPADVVDQVLEGLSVVLDEAGIVPAQVLGLGVAVSGVVEGPADAVVHAQTLGWDAVPLGAMLAAGTDLPIQIDNGANTLGQAEMWFGAGRGATDAVVALVGSGVGAALVAGGLSYPGARSSAGEWGHTTITYGGRRCRCGAEGCLEAYVGAKGVLERFQNANNGRPAPGDDEESAFVALLDSVGTSKVAAEVVEETIGYLGAGFANLVNLLNPERIVLGGWAGLLLGERFLPELRVAIGRHALRQPYSQVSIELCELGRDAVAMGAATLPVVRLLREGGVVTRRSPGLVARAR